MRPRPPRPGPAAYPAEVLALLERLAARMREGRARRGLKLLTLARDSGLPVAQLADIECGRVAAVDVTWLLRIAAGLHVALVDLVAGPGRSPLDTPSWYAALPDEPETNQTESSSKDGGRCA